MTSGTAGDDDTKTNHCGIKYSHAYSILSLFQMSTNDGNEYELMMIRNPRMESEYNQKWNTADYESWTPELRA